MAGNFLLGIPRQSIVSENDLRIVTSDQEKFFDRLDKRRFKRQVSFLSKQNPETAAWVRKNRHLL
jgi:hypothetical protein